MSKLARFMAVVGITVAAVVLIVKTDEFASDEQSAITRKAIKAEDALFLNNQNTIIAWTIIITVLAWYVFGLEKLEPTEVGLRKYFGGWEHRIWVRIVGRPLRKKECVLTSDNGFCGLGTGLHWVPPIPGMDMVRYSKEMFNLVFKAIMSPSGTFLAMGEAIEVRTDDNQKIFVDAAAYFRAAYDYAESLALMYEAKVPRTNKNGELADYIKEGVTPEVLEVYGKEKYLDVIGGKKNTALSDKINKRLQEPKPSGEESLFKRLGLFGEDPEVNIPGDGEFSLKIQFGHLAPRLSNSVEDVGIAERAAEAAKSTAKRDAEETAGRVLKMVARKAGITVKELKDKLKADPKLRGKPASDGGYKEHFEFAEQTVLRDRAGALGELADIRIGGTHGEPLEVPVVLGGGAMPFIGLGQGGSKKKGGSSGTGGGGQQSQGQGQQGGGSRRRAPWQ